MRHPVRDYAGWVLLLVVFLVWELTGLRKVRGGMPAGLQHPSLSEVTWRSIRVGKWPVRLLVGGFLVSLLLHFQLGTPLIPGVG